MRQAKRVPPRLFHSVLLLCVFSVFYFGCSGQNKDVELDETVYVTVNGEHLTESRLRSIVPGRFYDRLTSEHKTNIIDEWIQNELLYQEAINAGIDRDPSIVRLLNQLKQQLLSNELLERRLSDIQKPTESVIRQYYRENEEVFRLQSNEYNVRYALFDNKTDANSFHRKVKRNESFSDLSREFSKDPSSQDGGNIGVVKEENVEPSVWEAIISTKTKYGLHKISDPFTVIDGWSCIIIDEMYETGTIKPYEYVRDLVYDMYIADKREDARQVFINELLAEAEITRYVVNR